MLEDLQPKLIADSRNNKVKVVYTPKHVEGEVNNHSDCRAFVHADRDRIAQVISNLLNNALKFTNQGIVSVAVSITKEYNQGEEGENEKEVLVIVEDTGLGIDPEIFPRLFTKFSSKSFSGTGLGLYISKSIIEAHGGKIWAKNNNDQKRPGASFCFTLPLAI